MARAISPRLLIVGFRLESGVARAAPQDINRCGEPKPFGLMILPTIRWQVKFRGCLIDYWICVRVVMCIAPQIGQSAYVIENAEHRWSRVVPSLRAISAESDFSRLRSIASRDGLRTTAATAVTHLSETHWLQARARLKRLVAVEYSIAELASPRQLLPG
jgi:hypothetical protein